MEFADTFDPESATIRAETDGETWSENARDEREFYAGRIYIGRPTASQL
jgi:hypothetical protein